jgi:hypothetical protein
LLEFVQVRGHFECRAVQVLGFSRRAIGLHLHGDDHEHVVDPEPGLAGQTVRRGVSPLLVGDSLTEAQAALVFGLNVNLEGDRTEHAKINVPWLRHEFGIGRC